MPLKILRRNIVEETDLKPEFDPREDVLSRKIAESGDKFEKLYSGIYRESFQSLYNYGMHIIEDKALVKDCIQELFVKLWKNKNILLNVKFIKPYLFKSLKRIILHELKAQKNNKSLSQPGFQFEISPELRIIKDQQEEVQLKKLKAALDKLTIRQREALYLKFYERLSYDATSSALNISTKATYKLVARAISLLKENVNRVYMVVLLCILLYTL